jgi:hypothetical protein
VPRLRKRLLEIIDVAVGGDIARMVHEGIGDPAQCLDLGSARNIRKDDDAVAAIGGEVGSLFSLAVQ